MYAMIETFTSHLMTRCKSLLNYFLRGDLHLKQNNNKKSDK